MSEGTLGETTPDSRHINNDDMSPSTTHSGDPMVPRSSHRSRLLFWLKKHEPARAVVLSPFDLKRDLDDELHTREGGDAFISTMGNVRVVPRRLSTRGAVKDWLLRLGLPALSRALGPSLEDQVHLFGDDFVNTAQTGDIVLVERKCLFEHRRVSSDVLRGVAGTVSHHFLPKRTSVEPWTDVGLVVEIVLPALNNQRCAVKSVVSIDDNGAIFIRSLIQFVGEVHADASTCALRRLSCVVPCPDPASGGQGPERSHARARSNSHPSRVAADIPSAGSKLSPIPISASPNHSSEPVRSRITVMSKLTAFIQAIVDFTMRTSHAFKINASYPTALPIHLSYHDLMLASSVASCRPCIGALDAAARRAGRTSKYPSVDDVNNLIQIFFTIDRDQIGSVPIGIVREFVDPTMRAAGGAGEMMRPRGAMVRSREEIEARLREMDINEDGVISLEEFVHAFFREVRGAADAPVAAGSSLVHRGSAVGDLRGVLQAEFVAALLVQAGCLDIRSSSNYSPTSTSEKMNSSSKLNTAIATAVDDMPLESSASGADACVSSTYLEMSDYFLPSSFSSRGPVTCLSDAVAASTIRRRQGSPSSKGSTLNSLLRKAPVSVVPSEGGGKAGGTQSVILPSPIHIRNDADASAIQHMEHRHSSVNGQISSGIAGDAVRPLPELVVATEPWLAWEPEVFLVHRDAHAWF